MPLQIGPSSWLVNNLLVGSGGARIFSTGGMMFFTDTTVPPISLNALAGGVIQSNTLDQAYDNFGGGGPAGAGRLITADAGPVFITKPTADAFDAFGVNVTAGTGSATQLRGFLEMLVPFAPPAVSPLAQMRLYMDGSFAQLSTNGSAYAPIATVGGTGGSLDDAYNTTPAAIPATGVGRIINADAGAVRIQKSSVDANNAFEVDVTAGTGLAALFTGASISCPDLVVAPLGERFGAGATLTGDESVAVGQGAVAGFASNAIGRGSDAGSATFACNVLGHLSVAGVGGVPGCIAIGHQCSAGGGNDAIAIGSASISSSNSSIAFGNVAVASGLRSINIGFNGSATGGDDVAIGPFAVASGGVGIALGFSADATALGAIAIGRNAQSTVANNIAIGSTSVASGINTIAIGNSATAAFANCIMIGNLATTAHQQAVVVGAGASVNGGGAFGGIAIGFGATAGDQCVCVGRLAAASNQGAVAIGQQAVANESGTAVGFFANANFFQGGSVAVGNNSSAVGIRRTAVGALASAGATDATALGNTATASGANAVALGRLTVASGIASFAVGLSTVTSAIGAIGIGGSAISVASANSIAIGSTIIIAATNTNTIVIGFTAAAIPAGASDLTAIGNGVSPGGAVVGCTVVGRSAIVGGSSTSVFGAGARATGNFALALGAAADCGPNISSIALGTGATCSAANQLMIGAAASAITEMRIGNGASSVVPSDTSIRTTASAAAGVRGADLAIFPGAGGAGARNGWIALGGAVARSGVDHYESIGVGSIRDVADAAFPATQVETDFAIRGTVAGLGRVFNLLSTTGRQGRMICISKIGAGGTSIVITPAGGDTVDGVATLTITGAPTRQCVWLQADDVNNDWLVLANRT